MTRYWTAGRRPTGTRPTAGHETPPPAPARAPQPAVDATARLAGSIAAAVAGLADTDRPDLWHRADSLRGAWAAWLTSPAESPEVDRG